MANTKFQFKRTTISGRLPNTTNSSNSSFIDAGEFAVNLTDGKIVSSNGTVTFEVGANLSSLNLGGSLTANGSNGSSGQVLTSNASGVYWSTVSGSVNTAAQYAWTNTHSFAATVTYTANLTMNTASTILQLGNSTVAVAISANGSNGTSGQVLTSNATSVYWGTPTLSAGGNTIVTTGTGSNQAITLSSSSATANDLIVTYNGIRQLPNSYLVTSGTLYVTALSGSDIIVQLAGGPTGPAGAGPSITANTTDTQTFYLPMSNTTSGAWSNAVISNTKLYFVPSTGTLNATVFNSLSDKRLKENIETIPSALDVVKSLNGVSFNWKDNGLKSYGVIAQEVEKILPALVSDADPKSVNYSGIIAFLINAIKELHEEVQANKCCNSCNKK